MAGARAAIRYAKAVLSLATDQKAANAVNIDMKQMANTIAQSKDLSDMVHSPVVSAKIKKLALLDIFKGSTTITVNLLDILAANKRVPLLEQVALKYSQLFDASRGTQVAIVTTAIPITDTLKIKVLAKAKALTGKDVELENRVDESIIGGFILRIGDIQYNSSIANQLSKLKREFTLN